MEITLLKGVGERVAQKLARLGIKTVQDLLLHIPRDYNDFSTITPIERLRVGQVSVKARLERIHGRYVRRGMHIIEATLRDDTGAVKAVWFNQPYLLKTLKVNKPYYFSGEYSFQRQRYQLLNPAYEPVDAKRINAARVLPIYPQTKGVTSKQLRRLIMQAIEYVGQLPPDMPDRLAEKYARIGYHDALRLIHLPDDIETADAARQRLAFGELFALSLASIEAQTERIGMKATPLPFKKQSIQDFVASLPYELTADQKRSAWEVLQDMSTDSPMNRLLDGDVGSGKTVVAAMAVLNAIKNGAQVAVIAPTTILAEQHLKNITDLLGDHAEIGFLSSSLSNKQKNDVKKDIATGRIDVAIGTHALLQPDVDFKSLGLIVIDEQHRFGVEQRRSIQARLGILPHALSMSATPIPRSLALTLYGELDISLIKTMPPGRKPIETKLFASGARRQVDELIEEQLQRKKQAYVVTPLIEESDLLPAISAEQAVQRYQKRFSSYSVALLHGKMKDEEKSDVMQQFSDGKINILVSTTVIEVGVDVPNATVMVIEGAERFGLAQLHQLRGRVGRGDAHSLCLLVTSDSQRPPKRLEAVLRTNSGFELAELDLELRGGGAIYGVRQSGALDLRIATLGDASLVKQARAAAEEFHESGEDLIQYPQLAAQVARFKAITNLN